MSKPRNSSEVSNAWYIKGLIVWLMTLLATAVWSAEAKTTVNPESGFKRTSITKKSTKTEIDKILSEIAASWVDINSLSNISIMEALNQLGYEWKAWDQRWALYSFFGKKDAYKWTSSQNTFLVTALKTYLKDKVPTNSEEIVSQEITTWVQTKAATILTSSVITATEPKKENITPSIEPKIKETKQSVSDTLIGITPSGKKYSELTADERLAEQQRLVNEQIKAESGSPKATNELTSAIKLQTGSKTENDQKVDTLNGWKLEKSINEWRWLISLGVNFSSNQWALVNFMIGHMMWNNFAWTVEVEVGAEEARYLATLGYKINENNRVKITFEHFEQVLNFSFTSWSVKEKMSQQSAWLAYEYRVPNEFIEFIQAKGYFTKAWSKDLSTVNLGTRDVVIDTVTLYELYRETRDEYRRLAWGTKVGWELSVGLVPWKDGKLKVATNFESINYDTKYEWSKYDTARFWANLELSQKFLKDFEVKWSVWTSSSEELVYGAEINYQALDNLKIYFNGKQINRRAWFGWSDSQETRFWAGLTWVFWDKQTLAQSAKSYNDAMKSRMDEISKNSKLTISETKQVAELLSWISRDPVVRSNTVLVVADKKIETTSTRLIAIDKTLLPAWSDVDAATGNILQDIVPAIWFNNITFNWAAFTNNWEFSIDNLTNKLVINTWMLAIPAVGATNTYIITIDEVWGGQTIVNLQTEHGSVKIKSMTVTRVWIDINPPTIWAPTAVVSNNSANVTNNITDVDWIQNVVYYLYSDSSGNTQVANNSTWIFSWLNASTDYWIKTTAQTKNNPANTRTTRTSSLVKITTLANDISTTLSIPVFGSKTDTTITINDSTISFSDADWIQNTEIQISTDPAFGTVNGTLPGLTWGIFSWLTASNTYYIRIVWEARNGTTSVWQSKVTPTLTVVTSAAEIAPIMWNIWDQTFTSGSAITNLNVSNYVSLTNWDAITAYTLTWVLPTWLSFNSTTWVLSWTPTETWTFPMSVTATDNDWVSNSVSFTITVNAAPDSTPDQFTFSDKSNVALSTLVESAPIIVAWINTASSISVTWWEYAISTDNWATYWAYTAVAWTVNNWNYVKVRHTSSASNSTTTNTTLTIGWTINDMFTSITVAANVAPTANNFTYDTNIWNAAKTFDWNVLSAAADANGDSLSASVKTQWTKWTASISWNNLTYTPNAWQWWSDTVVVTISDGNWWSVDITITVNGIDTAAPWTPTVSIATWATYTNSTANSISITDSDNIWVTWRYVTSDSSSTPTWWAWTSTKPTTWTISSWDGTKTLYVFTKDAAGNISAAGNDTIVLDTVAPSSMSFSWTIPDTKNSAYTWLILALWEDLTWWSLTSLTSSTWWTISWTISWWNIFFDWTTPNAWWSQLRAIWTDRAWNAFDLLLSVSLPN